MKRVSRRIQSRVHDKVHLEIFGCKSNENLLQAPIPKKNLFILLASRYYIERSVFDRVVESMRTLYSEMVKRK